jgi:hypothetical protein
MIDVYATEGTFEQGGQLAADLARTLMVIEGVPDIPMFRLNTAAFIHQMPAGSISNVEGQSNYVRVEVMPLDADSVRGHPGPGAAVWPAAEQWHRSSMLIV